MVLQPEKHCLVIGDSLDGYVIVKYTYVCKRFLLIEGFKIKKFFKHFNMKSICRLEKSTLILEGEGFPVLLPSAESFNSAEVEVDCPEKEEELGIFQVLDRLEKVTSMLTSR